MIDQRQQKNGSASKKATPNKTDIEYGVDSAKKVKLHKLTF
jgi:hypothetical protein